MFPLSFYCSQTSKMSSNAYSEISSNPLTWLHGTWESYEAAVSYPTMETVNYFERMIFDPLSPILLDYSSDSWNIADDVKLHIEKGFLKVQADTGTIAFVVTHNFGLTELDEGFVDGQTLHLNSRCLCWMSFTKLTQTKQVVRDFVLKDDILYQTVLMETIKTPLQTHLEVKYKKKDERSKK